ncbi:MULTISPECIES: patatin-like phospholipase family protein [spotted fever group]|uniref:Patatin n=1 Tax=Rickettsia tamurae subsp. buchneri TaxID=1462938 RepID=A0A8E0WKP7_9RICK|nr:MULTISPECIES: patatin-like phospholipase family protein [spotted fever group]EER22505.1 patatin b1 [Rickettsia endosymbiont of Ixodes scapularis]KDO02304.1 Patatin [Rickettsia tamurae subsp. buchneri]
MTEKIDNIKIHRTLTLSGGGIKIAAMFPFLIELEERTGKSISELFPIMAGASAGALAAALLTIPKEPGSKEAKYSAKEAFEIFKSSASGIFPDTFLGSVKQIFTHKHSQKPLKELLEKYISDNRMDSPTSRLIISVNDLTTNGTGLKIFDSFHGYGPHVKLKDVLLATTAAPTYFKPVIGPTYAYADGGLDTNRPENEVLKLLKKGYLHKEQNHIRKEKTLTREEQKEILDHTMVCAINFSNDLEPTNSIPKIGFDGVIGWLVKGKLINRLMTNKEASSTAEAKNDLPGKDEFFEIGLPITKETESLDNASPENIAKLEEIGRKYVAENSEQIQRLCDTLIDNLNKEQAANQTVELIDENFEEDENIENNNEAINKTIAQALDSDDEGFEEDPEYEKDELLNDIKKFLNAFSKQNPTLKTDIDNFLQKAENYTLEEIKECIISFEQASSKWQSEPNNLDVFSSCSMEALKEDIITLEGEEHTDNVPGYNEIVA